ncbi:hypothetical protein EC957_010124 [Mortierella hygrophila]|uniref:Uncharacterized protein n=1 Tax=Mortierella hygrophila TaxID=979708 RepID=A0A9P6FAB0_9FUNG|nr:hypothetical protein EC957_010124 [Mortierella hygrophila]
MRQWVHFLAIFNFFATIDCSIKFFDGLYIHIVNISSFIYIYSLMSYQPRRGNTFKFTRALLLLLVAGTLFDLRLFWAVWGR